MKPLMVAVGRCLVGLALVISGVSKALEPAKFLADLHAYPLASVLPVLAVAALLPWAELFVGFCLLAGLAPRAAALWSTVLLAIFVIALAQRAISAPHTGAWFLETFDCGCGLGTVQVGVKLLEDLGLLCLSVWTMLASSQRFVLTDPA